MRAGAWVAAVALAALACGGNVTRVRELHVPEGSTDTRDQPIRARVPQTLVLVGAGVRLDDDFEGGAFVSAREDERGVELLIAPENSPINDSAWFAFRIASTGAAHDVTITLRYEGGTHRYLPRQSPDGDRWTSLPAETVVVAADKTRATFTLHVGAEPIFVAAQELVTAAAVERWAENVAAHPFVRRGTLGDSVAGRPLGTLRIAEAATGPRPTLVILGRQHPPEVTGTLALMRFVETLCGDGERARAFRRRYDTLVIPVLNPDGVVAGHWRHNLHGIDLNRDWEHFRQAETRAARDALVALGATGVAFAVDFHSTFNDVFYVLPAAAEPSSRDPAAVWIAAIARRLPAYRYKVQPVTTTVPAASIWLHKTFGISTVTYEVGDATDRRALGEISEVAADELMRLLLER